MSYRDPNVFSAVCNKLPRSVAITVPNSPEYVLFGSRERRDALSTLAPAPMLYAVDFSIFAEFRRQINDMRSANFGRGKFAWCLIWQHCSKMALRSLFGLLRPVTTNEGVQVAGRED